MSFLELKALSFKRGSAKILQDFNCSFAYGETTALLGANGSGKTTLLHLISGYHRFEQGEMWRKNQQVAFPGSFAKPSFRAELGMVFQEPSLDGSLSAIANLRLSGRVHGIDSEILEKKILNSLEWADLSERKNEATKKFSGGMKKKLEIMRAMLHDPSLLLFDEATSGLDYFSCQKFWECLENKKAQGSAVIMVTHRLDEIEKCDRVVMLYGGKVVGQGTPSELLKNAGGDRISIQLKGDVEQINKLGISSWANVMRYQAHHDGDVHIIAKSGSEIASRISGLLPANVIRSITVRPPTVADAYHSFTGVDLERL